jgi:hypothetical protein
MTQYRNLPGMAHELLKNTVSGGRPITMTATIRLIFLAHVSPTILPWAFPSLYYEITAPNETGRGAGRVHCKQFRGYADKVTIWLFRFIFTMTPYQEGTIFLLANPRPTGGS